MVRRMTQATTVTFGVISALAAGGSVAVPVRPTLAPGAEVRVANSILGSISNRSKITVENPGYVLTEEDVTFMTADDIAFLESVAFAQPDTDLDYSLLYETDED